MTDETTATTTKFGGIGYRSRSDMVYGAVSDWLYGATNTDAEVASYLSTTTPQALATLMAINGWLGEIHKSDPSVCHADMVDAIESVTEALEAGWWSRQMTTFRPAAPWGHAPSRRALVDAIECFPILQALEAQKARSRSWPLACEWTADEEAEAERQQVQHASNMASLALFDAVTAKGVGPSETFARLAAESRVVREQVERMLTLRELAQVTDQDRRIPVSYDEPAADVRSADNYELED